MCCVGESCKDCLFSKEENKHQRVTWMQSLIVYLIYIMQSSNGVFSTLYPILYEREGYPLDYQSFLNFGMIPWCLKFIPGWIFSNIYDPPRWLIIILHILLGILSISMAFIPLNNITATITVYFVQSSVAIFHDVAFDAHVSVMYKDRPALPALIQLMGYLTLDVIVGFIAVGVLGTDMFVYIGIFILIGIPYFWLIPWTPIPKETITNIGKSLKSNIYPLLIFILVWFTSSFGETLYGVFISEMLNDDPKDTSIAFGIGTFASVIGSILGNVLSANRKMCYSLPLFIGISSLIELTLIAGYYNRKVWVHSLVYSLTSIASGASTMPCEIISFYAASKSTSPALIYSIFNSVIYILYTINGFISPQLKKVMEWPGYWGFSCGLQFLGSILITLVVIFGLSDDVRNLRPRLWITQNDLVENDDNDIENNVENISSTDEEEKKYSSDSSSSSSSS